MFQNNFMDFIRMFFSWIDNIVYGMISTVYTLIEQMAQYKIFETLDVFIDKIYVVLGIFMLFKVSFSFINYIVNPDSLTDKEKGIQNIIKNIVIMFIMLVMCPWAFNQLWGVQNAILEENVLAQFVFGNQETQTKNEYKIWDGCSTSYQANSNGDYIALMILKGFYSPYTKEDAVYNMEESEFVKSISDVLCPIPSVVKGAGKPSYYLNSILVNASYGKTGGNTLDTLWNATTIGMFTNMVSNLINGEKPDIYIINYKFILSTVVGVIVLLILVGFALDVGMRVIKLSFLQLIAPIPIVSYIDPASGKNGMFKKWLKEVGGTWASLFIRLFALFFAIVVIQQVGSLVNTSTGKNDASVWVQIFVIIGALMFAKKLPSLIENIAGFKFEGGFGINPLKKFKDQALLGKEISSLTGKTLGAARGAVGGAISGAQAGKEVGATKTGMLLGAIGGAAGGFKNNKGSFTKQMREQYKTLTGNEMARFSISKTVLQERGKGEVGKIKDVIGEASSQLNQAEINYNTAATTVGNLKNELTRRGVSTDNITASLNQITADRNTLNTELTALQNSRATLQANMNNEKSQYDTQKQKVDVLQRKLATEERKMKDALRIAQTGQPIGQTKDASGKVTYVYSQEVEDARKVVAEYTNKRDQIENEIKVEQTTLQTYQQSYDIAKEEYNNNENNINSKIEQITQLNDNENMLNEYTKHYKDANELKKVIFEINKDIDVLKKEKGQRENFYQVDNSQNKSVNDAISNTATRRNNPHINNGSGNNNP